MQGTALVERRKVSVNEVVVEEEKREYLPIPVIKYPNGTTLEVMQVKKREIIRGPRRYVTDYQYRLDPLIDYADYHRPWRIAETGEIGDGVPGGATTRVTTRQYIHADSPPSLNVGHLLQEDVISNGQTSTRSRVIQPTTGRIDSQTVYGVTTTFGGFNQGMPQIVTDANAHVTNFAYAWGIPNRVQTPRHTFTREVHQDGTVRWETLGVNTPNARTTFYEYDELFRVKKIIPPAAPGGRDETRIEYAADGTWTKTTRGASWVKTTVDGFGRPIRTENSDGVTMTTGYDADGRTIYQGYPFREGQPDIGTEIEYDVLGRVTKRTNPGPSPRTFVTFKYEPGTITIRDEKGRETIHHVQAFGNPDDTRLVGLTDALERKWTYEHDALGKLTKVIAPDLKERRWVYDSHGWLESETHPESGTTTYGYGGDNVGNVRTRTDAKNQTLVFDYDENDRLWKITGAEQPIEIIYEPGSDNRAETRVGTDTTKHLYDAAGRLVGQRGLIGGRLFETRYTPNKQDNVSAITYPSMRTVMYEFDAENRVERVWDPLANVTYASQFEYDHPSGALTSFRAGNDITSTFDFHETRYWLMGVHSGPLDLVYDHDEVGNVLSIADARGGSWNQTFTYDALDRLETANGPYGAIAFAYDMHGNMTSQGSDTFTYDSTTMRLATRNGQAVVHDNNGSVEAEGPGIYTYTTRNHMATATINGATSTYKYDADDWRTMKTTPDGTTTYDVRGPQGQLLSELIVTAAGTENRRE